MSTKTKSVIKTTTKEKEMTTKLPPKRKGEGAIDQANHPLASHIPDKFYIEDYVSRDVSPELSDLDMMAAAHRTKHNVLLSGPTGSAKTSLVYAYAAKVGMPVVNVACNGAIDPKQMLGGWLPSPDGGYQFQPGDLTLGVLHGAIILFNEVNFMPPKIAAAVFGLLDRRRTLYIHDASGSDFPTAVRAHPSTLICADYNPGYQGTRPLNQAFKNRFAFKMDWGYDHGVEAQLVNSPALLELVEGLRKRAEVGDISTPISTNMMMEFEDLAYDDALGIDFAFLNFVNAFEPEERLVVMELLNLNRSRIESELFPDAKIDN